MPLTCNSPNFGSILIGVSSNLSIICTANIPITSLQGLTLKSTLFQAQNSSLPNTTLAVGDSFSFPVLFDLTGNATGLPLGVQTSVLNLLTVNGQTGYSTAVPISITGRIASANPVISVSPIHVGFPGIVLGSSEAIDGSESSFAIASAGEKPLTVFGYAFTTGVFDNTANSTVTNITFTNGTATLDGNGYFTSLNLPAVGTVIKAGREITVDVLFNTTV